MRAALAQTARRGGVARCRAEMDASYRHAGVGGGNNRTATERVVGSAWSIHVAAVFDPEDDDFSGFLADPVEDAVGPAGVCQDRRHYPLAGGRLAGVCRHVPIRWLTASSVCRLRRRRWPAADARFWHGDRERGDCQLMMRRAVNPPRTRSCTALCYRRYGCRLATRSLPGRNLSESVAWASCPGGVDSGRCFVWIDENAGYTVNSL